MNLKEYQEKALRTNTPNYEDMAARAVGLKGIHGVDKNPDVKKSMDLLHAALLLTSEAGEFADAVKKHIVYGKELDEANLIEEAGDLLWALNLALTALDSDLGTAMDKNIRKLKKRFPEGFTEEKALNRDLKTERKELEK